MLRTGGEDVKLRSHGMQDTGYKGRDRQSIRKKIVSKLGEKVVLTGNIDIPEQNADTLDSTICLLAAKDFIEGNVYYPQNMGLAKREGWIWVLKNDDKNGSK